MRIPSRGEGRRVHAWFLLPALGLLATAGMLVGAAGCRQWNPGLRQAETLPLALGLSPRPGRTVLLSLSLACQQL